MGKFVSQNNLSYFWQKIKTLLNSKADKSEIPTNDFNDLENKPVFRYTAPQSFTLVNYDNIQEGVHILPYGASIYYGDSSSSTSTTYMVSTGAGSVVIFTKNSTGRTVYFKAFTNKEVITGATSSSSCVARTIKFADGTSDLNKILKVTTATNNSSKIKTEATWVTPDYPNNGTLTIQKNGTNVATFGANSASNVTANISVPTNTSQLTNDSGFVTSSSLGTQATFSLSGTTLTITPK
jgi:hypothetical protein